MKDDLELNLEYVVHDSVLQIKSHIDKYNEEHLLRLKTEKLLLDKIDEC